MKFFLGPLDLCVYPLAGVRGRRVRHGEVMCNAGGEGLAARRRSWCDHVREWPTSSPPDWIGSRPAGPSSGLGRSRSAASRHGGDAGEGYPPPSLGRRHGCGRGEPLPPPPPPPPSPPPFAAMLAASSSTAKKKQQIYRDNHRHYCSCWRCYGPSLFHLLFASKKGKEDRWSRPGKKR
ncbi:hypothetical protein NL676_007383 [Syzygium grande]|nr:hypothetical protein NL676_007383 [Syzygium grande]